jgi:hypothetical protein
MILTCTPRRCSIERLLRPAAKSDNLLIEGLLPRSGASHMSLKKHQ